MQIGIITGSRAEYGLLEGLINEFKDDQEISTKVIATGAHATKKYVEVSADETVEILLDSNTENGITKSIGLGIISFTEFFKWRNYDAIIVLGDRFEIYSAVVAAYNNNIIVAHIHGGEETKGSLDNGYRHSISLFSNLHFVAHEEYEKRLVNFGINKKNIFNVGALGVDGLVKRQNWKNKKMIMVCHYPNPTKLLFLTKRIRPDLIPVIITPNPDIEYAGNIGKSYKRNDFIKILATCDFMIGNSSAGIIEAPALGVPSINVGSRQEGRLMASSIINCDLNEADITEAIQKVQSKKFIKSLKDIYQPYQGQEVAKKIKNNVKETYYDKRNQG